MNKNIKKLMYYISTGQPENTYYYTMSSSGGNSISCTMIWNGSSYGGSMSASATTVSIPNLDKYKCIDIPIITFSGSKSGTVANTYSNDITIGGVRIFTKGVVKIRGGAVYRVHRVMV